MFGGGWFCCSFNSVRAVRDQPVDTGAGPGGREDHHRDGRRRGGQGRPGYATITAPVPVNQACQRGDPGGAVVLLDQPVGCPAVPVAPADAALVVPPGPGSAGGEIGAHRHLPVNPTRTRNRRSRHRPRWRWGGCTAGTARNGRGRGDGPASTTSPGSARSWTGSTPAPENWSDARQPCWPPSTPMSSREGATESCPMPSPWSPTTTAPGPGSMPVHLALTTDQQSGPRREIAERVAAWHLHGPLVTVAARCSGRCSGRSPRPERGSAEVSAPSRHSETDNGQHGDPGSAYSTACRKGCRRSTNR